MAKTINLRDHYPWYTHDEFIEVSDDVAEEMLADIRYEKTHERITRRFNVHSLDADDGTEEIASLQSTDRPDIIVEMMERYCNLCRALNSLPEIQGRRIEAHFIDGMSTTEIAETECVNDRNVRHSLSKGLTAMKKYLENHDKGIPD